MLQDLKNPVLTPRDRLKIDLSFVNPNEDVLAQLVDISERLLGGLTNAEKSVEYDALGSLMRNILNTQMYKEIKDALEQQCQMKRLLLQ